MQISNGMQITKEFADRAASYLGVAKRARDRRKRGQYLHLAACCYRAAAKRADSLTNDTDQDGDVDDVPRR
jgi:hypothetical protein